MHWLFATLIIWTVWLLVITIVLWLHKGNVNSELAALRRGVSEIKFNAAHSDVLTALTDKSQNLEDVTRSGAQMALDLRDWQDAFSELRRRVPGLASEEHYWNGSLMRDLLEEREERLAAEKVAQRKNRMEQG